MLEACLEIFERQPDIDKLTKEIIIQYYNILKNPRIKYTKKQDLALYDAIEEQIGSVNYENIDIVEQWINENILSFADKVIRVNLNAVTVLSVIGRRCLFVTDIL